MILKVEPGEDCLEGAVGTAPAVVIVILIAVMIVLVDSFGVVLDIFLFGLSADK